MAGPQTKQKVVDYSYNSRDTLVLMDSFGPAQQNYSIQDLLWKNPLIIFSLIVFRALILITNGKRIYNSTPASPLSIVYGIFSQKILLSSSGE